MSRNVTFIFIAAYILVGLGIVMTYSASAIYADEVYNNAFHFLYRQIFYAVLGTAVMFLTASMPIVWWKKNARFFILLAIFFLLMVFVPVIGRTAGGAQRWIRLGLFNFQPAEFAKIAVCLYLSDYLSRKRKIIQGGSLTIFVPPLSLIGLVCGLTLIQPDLGSCAFIFLIVSILLFWSGIKMRYVFIAALFVLPVFYFLVVRVPYRLSRVSAYLNPWEDPRGSGFQIIQSFLAYGLGGVQGVGIGQGMQKLFYLPSSYNDFILSVIGEEMGLLGVFFVLALYGVIFISGIRMIEKTNGEYEQMLTISLILVIVLQAVINMLVTTGLVPTKGLPLPFVSYGGSSLIFNLMALGLLLSMDKHLRKDS